MEKFRYRKQNQILHDEGGVQLHHPQQEYDIHHTNNHQHPENMDDQRTQKRQFCNEQRLQQYEQFYNDQIQHQYEHDQRQRQQQEEEELQQSQFIPELKQHPHQYHSGQRKDKQQTDWDGVLQDLFGMDVPQTEESIHDSTSSGVASDVTSVYLPTPTMTTFKGGDSAGSASSAKSTVSRDSGTKSASVSESPRPDRPFQKPYPRGVRTSPAIPPPAVPKNAPPVIAKSMQPFTNQCHCNGKVHQGNACSSPSADTTGEKRQSRERRQRLPEPNCIQCCDNINGRSCISQRNGDKFPNLTDCRSVDPVFCCELDQCYMKDMREEQFIESFGENRFIESPPVSSGQRDRLHLTSPSICPSPPGYCCNQSFHQSSNGHRLLSDMSQQNLKLWYKQQQLQHHHQHQQQEPLQQNRYSPPDIDNNISTTFDICNNHNHCLIQQSAPTRINDLRSSPSTQTFKPHHPNKTTRMACCHQSTKMNPQSKHNVNESQSHSVIPRSQTPKGSKTLLTHAQVHTPQLETRKRNENNIKPTYTQLEPQLNDFSSKSQFARDAESSRYLLTGINNLSLSQTENLKYKTPLMSASSKRLTTKFTPFEFLPNDVLLKIFSHLSTDHLCKCAQVSRHWYNAVWDNPILWTSIVINNPSIDIDRALKYLTRRLSYNTPKVCMILEKININNCCLLSDRGLQTVAKRCPELRYLEMQNCHLITNMGIKDAVSRCVNLERLDVTGCPMVTCISLMDSLISQNTSRHLQRIYLRYLDMTDCPNVTDEDLSIITSQCTQLLFFYLRRCPLITDLGVTYIANNCSSLRELSLSDCRNVTDLGMRELAKLRENLRYLSVAKCEKVSDQGVIHIARNCSKLRYLNVRGCEAFSDTGLEFLARYCPRLRSLDIGKCDITDDGLYALSMHCPNLRKLGVKSCDAITDKGIVLIAYRCSSLQQLHVQDCCLSPDAYAMVRKYCKRAIIEHTNPAIL